MLERGWARALRGLAVVAIAAGLATAAPAEVQAPPPKLSAEQIVAKNVAARGGLAAWRNVQTMVWIGHIESARAPAPGVLFVLQQQRPNMTRFEVNALGQKTVRVFNGTQGWKLRTAQNGGTGQPQPYTAQELKFARAGQGIDGPLIDAAVKGNVVTLEGLDEIEGHKAYRLELRLLSGERDRLWIDAKTFLEIRYDRTADSPAPAGTPPHVVSLVYRDYKTFEGLMLPSIIETGTGAGSTPDRMVIEKVMLNTPIDPRSFAASAVSHPPGRARYGSPGPAWQAPGPAMPSASAPAPVQDSAAAPPQ